MTNSVMITDWLNEGIILNSDCSLRTNNTFSGDINFYNYTQRGQRYLDIRIPIIQIQTINNVTVDNCFFRSFTKVEDGSNVQIAILSTNLCSGFTADGLVKYNIFTNNYFTSESRQPMTSVSTEITYTQRSDNNRRSQQILLENITAEHIETGETLFTFSTGSFIITANNLSNNNVTLRAG